MKIDSSNISMFSQNSFVKKDVKEESLRAWIGDQRPDFEGRNSAVSQLIPKNADMVSLSEKAKAQCCEKPLSADEKADLTASGDVKKLLVEMMVEMLTGRKQKIKVAKVSTDAPDVKVEDPKKAAEQAPQKAGWGIEYESHESHYEREEMTFKAEGTITTKDGREIKIAVQLSMSREFSSEQNVNLVAGDGRKKDPLVINLNSSPAQLTDSKVAFDIDSDGTKDQISFVRPGSGFLALDKNNDGVVNNGSELFGPQSGNGFSELAQYDQDGNKWIDENDAVYSKLLIWTKDATGKDSLSTLQANNIGAIYLGNVSAQFDMKNAANVSQGEAKSAGIYLNENGGAGTVQQIDLAV